MKAISHRYVEGTRESEREVQEEIRGTVEISNAFLSGKHGI